MLRIKLIARVLMLLLGMAGVSLSPPAESHEIRPALLQVTERPNGHYEVLWKQPTMGMLAVHLVPHISGGLLEAPPDAIENTSDFEIRRWHDLYAGPSGMDGRLLTVEGLDRTITDTLVCITLKDGTSLRQFLHPQAPSLLFKAGRNDLTAVDFLMLGIRHIALGADHLLFLLGLLLIINDLRMLLKTVSAFTVAHSLTLAAATLGTLRPSTPIINTLIALSILFIAPEALRARRGATSLTIRYPWVVAFLFGLLHGTGFASGLTSLTIPRSALLNGLLLFNIGIEVGQLTFIALVLLLSRSFRLMQIRWPRPVEHLPAYLVGILGAFWTFQYGTLALGFS